MSRWIFDDGTTTYTVPLNPDAMTSPFPERTFTHSHGARHNGARVFGTVESELRPQEWQFEGNIRDQAHHDALVLWSRKAGKVTITDHLAREWVVMFTSFAPTDRKPTPSVPWRLRYTMRALLLLPPGPVD